MGWSEKYKKSIDCDNPKGFSQRAHCKGRKKKMNEAKEKQDHEVSMAKTQVKKSIDNLQKVARVLAKKTDADNLPAWVQAKLTDTEHNTDAAASYMGEEKKKCGEGKYWCRTDQKCKKIPSGHHVMPNGDLMKDGEHEESGDVSEGKRDGKSAKDKDYSLRDWFKGGGWVQAGGKYDGKPCAKQPGQKTKPFCRDADDRAAMSKDEREKRAKKKRKEDPNPNRKGKAKIVTAEAVDATSYGGPENLLKKLAPKYGGGEVVPQTPKKTANLQKAHFEPEGEVVSEKKDACYKKVKARYDVWPSAYASGALVKCRKVGAANWGNKTKKESYEYSNWREESLQEGLPLAGLARLVLPGLASGLGKGAMRSLPYILAPEAMKTITVAQAAIPAIGAVAGVSRKIAADQEAKNLEKKKQLAAQGVYVEQYKEGDKVEYSKKTQKLIDRANETPIQNLTRRARETKNSIELKAPRNPLTLPEAKNDPCWVGYKQVGMKKKGGKMVPNCVKEGYSNWREELDEDWQKVNKGDKTDGMSQKAVNAYRRENPGSKLKTAVTEKNPKGKRAKRRKSFCARTDGQRKMHNIDCSKTPDKAICKARRRWRC